MLEFDGQDSTKDSQKKKLIPVENLWKKPWTYFKIFFSTVGATEKINFFKVNLKT